MRTLLLGLMGLIPLLLDGCGYKFGYKQFEERKDILRNTLFQGDVIFSGQEGQGYIVFPPLDHDGEEFTVQIQKMVLRFDYRNEPVETVDILYRFDREVYLAQKPRSEEG